MKVGMTRCSAHASNWARNQSSGASSAFVPLSFAPGEACQFDWSHEVVVIDGATTTIKVAHVRLCHSRMFFVRAYPRETQEMVFDAHDRAFAFFKGTCTRGIYDNMKTAVETIFTGKERLYNRRFLQMASHYLVEPVACTPASGREKGQVESQVGTVRQRHFGRDRTVYNPWHYVPVLLRKPGALCNGAPFKDWVLPGALEQIRRKLQGSSDGDAAAAAPRCREVVPILSPF